MTYMAMPLHQNPSPGVHNNFGRLLLGHQYYILTLFDLSLGVEKKILKEIMHFHYINNMATP